MILSESIDRACEMIMFAVGDRELIVIPPRHAVKLDRC